MSLAALVRKELRSRSRKASTLVMRILYLAFIGLVASQISLSARISFGGQGAYLLQSIMASEWVILGLASLIMPSMALSQERRSRTLEFLRVAGVRPREIVLGKVVGALALPLMLQLCALPVQFIAVSMGGVSVGTIALANAHVFLIMLVNAGFGAVGGAWGKGTLAVLLALVYYIVPPMAAELSRHPTVLLVLGWTPSLCYWGPPSFSVWGRVTGYLAGLAGAMVTFSLCIWLASALLERTSRAPEGGGRVARFGTRLAHWIVRLFRVEARLLPRLIWKRPLIWRETRISASSRPEIAALFLFFGLGAWALCFYFNSWRVDWHIVMEVTLYFFAGILPGMSLLRNLFEEKDKRSFTQLLAAPPGARALARAKFVHSIVAVWPFVFLLVLLGLTASFKGGGAMRLAFSLVFAPTIALCSASLGLLAASGLASQTRAVLAYLGLLWLWVFGGLILAAIAGEMALNLLSPAFALGPMIEGRHGLAFGALISTFANLTMGLVLAWLGLWRLERKMEERA